VTQIAVPPYYRDTSNGRQAVRSIGTIIDVTHTLPPEHSVQPISAPARATRRVQRIGVRPHRCPVASSRRRRTCIHAPRACQSSVLNKSVFVTACSHGMSLYHFDFRSLIIAATVGKGGSAVTRLLIADEHEMVRSGLRAILEAQPNWVVVAEAVDGKEAILMAIEAKPDVAVINSVLPLVSSIDVTRQIRKRFRRTEVLVFTTDGSATQIDALVKAGARGFLTTSTPQDDLIEAIQSLLRAPRRMALADAICLTGLVSEIDADPA
jgi:CheY-like chemotaxis protein